MPSFPNLSAHAKNTDMAPNILHFGNLPLRHFQHVLVFCVDNHQVAESISGPEPFELIKDSPIPE